MKKTFLMLILFLMLAAVAGCMTGDDSDDKSRYITVILTEGEGYTITGENPIKVKPGAAAEFEVEVQSEYIIDSLSGGAVYSDGVVRLENVNYPTTINTVARLRENYTYFLFYNAGFGTVKTSIAEKTLLEGTLVTLRAVPKEGSLFLGFSLGGYIKDGGETLGYSTEYTFAVSEGLRIYANYADASAKTLFYNANGGTVVNSSENSIIVEMSKSVYLCPNTLYDGGSFERAGYVLIGYNTAPDYSGRFYGLGWNVVMTDTQTVTLYAQWMPESAASDFKYTNSGGKITITSYTGSGDTVVIPEKINGFPVVQISAGAFSGSKFKTLILSKNLLTVADGAFVNCQNFTTLYFSDSITSISDAFYSNCPNFKTLIVNAVGPPKYMTSRNGNYQVKYERLITAQGKKLIVTGGSNVAYGVISEQLMAGLSNEYAVVNYGCNASTCAAFYIEVIASFTNPGDILVHAPEYNKFQWGYNEINTTLWQIFEGAYDAFSRVDIRNYTLVFTSFAEFNKARGSRSANNYEMYSSETVNIYGDYIKDKVGQTYTPSVKTFNMVTSPITGSHNVNLNRSLDMFVAAGGRCYLSFAAMNISAANDASRTTAIQNQYRDAAEKNIHITVISQPGDYLMESKYFYNSDYHLGTAGAVDRTNMLIRDIKAQFEKEK